MRNLLERDVTICPHIWDVLLNMTTPNFKTSECRCKCRTFARRSGRERCSGLRLDGVVRKRVCALFWRVSPQCHSVHVRSLLRGLCDARRQARSSALLRTLRVTVSICDGPTVNAELRPWESRPLARLRPV
jgi:hypothetical protein